jgi:hypothetical protein
MIGHMTAPIVTGHLAYPDIFPKKVISASIRTFPHD